jgi:hypothetical protein
MTAVPAGHESRTKQVVEVCRPRRRRLWSSDSFLHRVFDCSERSYRRQGPLASWDRPPRRARGPMRPTSRRRAVVGYDPAGCARCRPMRPDDSAVARLDDTTQPRLPLASRGSAPCPTPATAPTPPGPRRTVASLRRVGRSRRRAIRPKRTPTARPTTPAQPRRATRDGGPGPPAPGTSLVAPSAPRGSGPTRRRSSPYRAATTGPS